MSNIIIPNPNRKRALLVIDVQGGFLNDDNQWIVPNIEKVITKGSYDLIVESIFHTDPNSLWDRQTHWTFKLEPTISEIKELLGSNVPLITKTTKSAFKGEPNLKEILDTHGIEEVHLVGLDTNDCVMTTAKEAFDLGYWTYVIEEATESSDGKELRNAALMIMRNVDMTNHSELITSHNLI